MKLTLTLLMICLAMAQSTAGNTNLDIQNRLYEEQKNNPLEGKTSSIEVNPFMILAIDKAKLFFGGYSTFNLEKKVEYNFPVSLGFGDNSSEKFFILDGQYRKYLGNTLNGFFISGIARYANVNFPALDWFKPDVREHKFGIGIGFGYKLFSYSGFSWGINVSFGRYILGRSQSFDGDGIDDRAFFIDGEILKFGYAF